MANTYCHEAHCNLVNRKKRDNSNWVVIGSYVVYALIVTAATWYSVANGINIDPNFL
ncbi:hypothetical protein [Sporomusa acidovorans]|uniref:Uncharacterized protein n=1 Tax=Sporomusa acidovorans (strain ATCC 49682 / DSM 3132 / Mol) TaxID=1123286 RepID=A0ABZ3IXK4_SPOA4|nr:hypothetical protein [Sporomusa acidovorans]OZC23323.1 hypothetical protein SPACI_07350 [Sporomusa acidovorans DSM 3132]SDE41896.1 hypothetical protein SAMN04488499_101337 [Sporomusa acidovorans]